MKTRLNQLALLVDTAQQLSDRLADEIICLKRESRSNREILSGLADNVSTLAQMSLKIIDTIYDEIEMKELEDAKH